MLNIGDLAALPPIERLARQIYNFDLWMWVLLPLVALIYFFPNQLFGEEGYSMVVPIGVILCFLFFLFLNAKGYFKASVIISLILIFLMVMTTPLRDETWFEPLFLIPVGLNAFIYLPEKKQLSRLIFFIFVMSGTVSFFYFWDLSQLTPESLAIKIPVFKFGLSTFAFLLIYKTISLILLYQLSLQETEKMESRFRDLFENSNDSILQLDNEWHIVDANPAARKFLELPLELGSSVPDFIHPEDREKSKKYQQKLKEEGLYVGYQGRAIINGKVRYIEVNAVAIKDKNGIQIGSHDMIRDITIQKEAEKKLEQHVEDLTKANEELDSLVYKVAHDLRAPLTNVMGLINLARDDEEVKGAEKYLQLQMLSVERMDTFIRDIVDFTRNVRQEISKTPIDFSTLIDEVINLQQDEALGNNLTIYKDIEAGTFYSDPMRIRILLNNLISNAVQYADLEKDEPNIKMQVKITDEMCTFVIEDNGKGIEERYLEKVFDMFFRGNSKTRGSGLGLYIVKEIAEKLHAKIKLESELNRFTKVMIEFPNDKN